jgi:hypothetical protein
MPLGPGERHVGLTMVTMVIWTLRRIDLPPGGLTLADGSEASETPVAKVAAHRRPVPR